LAKLYFELVLETKYEMIQRF